jgi:hypothetical protein
MKTATAQIEPMATANTVAAGSNQDAFHRLCRGRQASAHFVFKLQTSGTSGTSFRGFGEGRNGSFRFPQRDLLFRRTFRGELPECSLNFAARENKK